MTTLTSKEAQNRFGEMMESAQREPIMIKRHGRPVAVVMSQKEYERLQAMEDAIWAERAKEAAAEGFLGINETKTFIENTLNANTESIETSK